MMLVMLVSSKFMLWKCVPNACKLQNQIRINIQSQIFLSIHKTMSEGNFFCSFELANGGAADFVWTAKMNGKKRSQIIHDNNFWAKSWSAEKKASGKEVKTINRREARTPCVFHFAHYFLCGSCACKVRATFFSSLTCSLSHPVPFLCCSCCCCVGQISIFKLH